MRTAIFHLVLLAFLFSTPFLMYGQEQFEIESDTESSIKFSNPNTSTFYKITSTPGGSDKEMVFRYNNTGIFYIQGNEGRIGIKKDFPNTDLHIQQPSHSKDLTNSANNNEATDAGITLDGVIFVYDEEYGDYEYPKWRIYVDINRNLAFEYNGVKRGYLQHHTNVGPIYATGQTESETKSIGNQEMRDLLKSLQKEISVLKEKVRLLEAR